MPVSAPTVLGRAIAGWGLGHVALGDRRGWVLLVLEAVWLVALLGAALAWLGSDRWLLVFALACGFLAVWTLQAIDAHRRAVAGGAPAEGASRILAIAPVAVVLVTLIFLVGGRVSTPGATFERYFQAWVEGDAAGAASLFAEPIPESSLASIWAADEERLTARLAAMRPPGPAGPPEPGRPPLDGFGPTFGAIRFEYSPDLPADGSRAQVDLLIVEDVRVRSTVLGIFPATAQETRVVARAGQATLRRETVGPALPFLPAAGVWRIEHIEID